MRKQIIIPTFSSLLILVLASAVQAQNFFNAVTNLHPLGYWPLNETNVPPASKPAAVNSGTLGAADNGTYSYGALPGVTGALAGDSDTAALFSGATGFNPMMGVPYDASYATNKSFTIEFWVNSPLDPGWVYAVTYAPQYPCPVNCLDAASPSAGWLIYEGYNGTPGTFDFMTFNQNGTTASLDMQMKVPPALLDSNGNMLTNTWYYLAVTFDGTHATGYINGQQVATGTASGYVASTTGGFTVGNRNDGGYSFEGSMDEVALYSNVLSAADILAHYQAATNPIAAPSYHTLVTNDNPLLYYRLDDGPALVATNYGTMGAFLNGYYESGLTPGAAGPDFAGFGPNSYACTFSGSGNPSVSIVNAVALLNLGDMAGFVPTPAQSVTLAAWVQVPAGAVSSFQSVAGTGDAMYRFSVDNPGGFPHFAEGGADAVGNAAVNDGQWHFWVGVWDQASTNEYIYTDGQLAGSASPPGGGSEGQPFVVGNAPDYNNRQFIGSVAQVALFSTALSTAQIQNLYVASAAPPVITTQPVPTVAMQGSNVSITVSAFGKPTLTYQWYSGTPGSGTPVSGGNVSGATSSALTFTATQPGNDGEYYVVVTDGNGSTVTSIGVTLSVLTTRLAGSYFPAVINLNPLAYWPLNETTLPALGDVATNYGTLGPAGDAAYAASGVTKQWSGSGPGLTPDGDTGIFTDGTAGMVGLPFSPVLSLAAPFSAEGWFLCSNPSAETCPLACVDANSPRSGWLIYMDGQNPGSYNFRMYNKNGASTSLNISSPANGITAGLWYHLVVVYDGTNGYIYVNGQLANSGTPSGFVPNDAGALTVGVRSDDAFYFDGGEADVAIYTNALSAATILAHYQTGTNNATPSTTYSNLVVQSNPLLYYKLDEPTYTAPPPSSDPVAYNYGALGANDNGYYVPGCFPGTVPGPQVAGFPNTVACRFNPLWGGYAEVPQDANNALDLHGPMTVTAWIQATPGDTRFESLLGRGDSSYRMSVDGGNGGAVHWALPVGEPVGSGVEDGVWHFIAATWDTETMSIYIDGALNISQSASGGWGAVSQPFIIGGVPDYLPGRIFNGNMSQVALFSTALSAAQIQALYYAAEVRPFITQQPVGGTIPQNANTTFTVVANGTPALAYQWRRNGLPVSGGEFSGATTAALTITGAQLGVDDGSYAVVVTNNYGAVTSSVAVLTITEVPSILSNLSTNPAMVYAGNVVPYSIGVVGSAPLTYRWYEGMTQIGGATSSNYTFVAAVGTNTYFVTISNAFGVVTSAVATTIGETFVPPPTGFTVNFAVNNYSGQGVYPDPNNGSPTNNYWNQYPGGTQISGALTIATVNAALSSASNATLVTGILNFGFNANFVSSAVNGTASYLLSDEDGARTGNPGIGTSANPEAEFIVSDLPPGRYTLYVYAANGNGDRGSLITLKNPGTADGGTNYTINGLYNGGADNNPPTSGNAQFAEGDNYVFFHQVQPDVTGTISGTLVPELNPMSGNTGEAPFNGLQVVLDLLSITRDPNTPGSVLVSWSGGVLYSASSVTGPWSRVLVGGSPPASPISTPATSGEQFFLVW